MNYWRAGTRTLTARLTTVRAEISRLRKILDSSNQPARLCLQPYGSTPAITTDAACDGRPSRRLRAALRLAPASTSRLGGSRRCGNRQQFSATLREVVRPMQRPTVVLPELHEASNDVEAMLALKLLPPDSPRRAVVTATLQRLAH